MAERDQCAARVRDRVREVEELEAESPSVARHDELRMRHAETLKAAREALQADEGLLRRGNVKAAQSGTLYQARSDLCQSVHSWFESLPRGTELAPYDGPPDKPKSGETLPQALEHIRAEGAELNKRRNAVERAPLTRDEQIAAAAPNAKRLKAAKVSRQRAGGKVDPVEQAARRLAATVSTGRAARLPVARCGSFHAAIIPAERARSPARRRPVLRCAMRRRRPSVSWSAGRRWSLDGGEVDLEP